MNIEVVFGFLLFYHILLGTKGRKKDHTEALKRGGSMVGRGQDVHAAAG